MKIISLNEIDPMPGLGARKLRRDEMPRRRSFDLFLRFLKLYDFEMRDHTPPEMRKPSVGWVDVEYEFEMPDQVAPDSPMSFKGPHVYEPPGEYEVSVWDGECIRTIKLTTR